MKNSLYQKCIDEGLFHLLSEWDAAKNEPLTPWTTAPGSHSEVWWRCREGHAWQAAVYSRVRGSGCPVCAKKKLAPGDNDLQTLAPRVAAQWHPTKNGDLTPDQVQPYSARRVWWQCEKGHEWCATITSRVKESSGCPICANRTILAGVNDLATLAPAIAAEWHPTKNGALTPQTVGAGSHKRVWWQCAKGHEWRAEISSRASGGCGCPVCNGGLVVPGENDLATVSPTLASEWHPTRNGELTPEQVRAQSNRAVWWRCDKGHEWKVSINARTQLGTGCPYCANKKVLAGFNDLATLEPKIAAQWDPELNGALTPQMVSKGSRRKVWWRCADGHVWLARVDSRTGPTKSGCPVCAGTVGEKRLNKMRQLEEAARTAQTLEQNAPVRVRYPLEIPRSTRQAPRESAL